MDPEAEKTIQTLVEEVRDASQEQWARMAQRVQPILDAMDGYALMQAQVGAPSGLMEGVPPTSLMPTLLQQEQRAREAQQQALLQEKAQAQAQSQAQALAYQRSMGAAPAPQPTMDGMAALQMQMMYQDGLMSWSEFRNQYEAEFVPEGVEGRPTTTSPRRPTWDAALA